MNLMALAKIHDLNKGMSEGLKYITSQNASQASIKAFFEKKIIFFGFPWCCTCEDLSINVLITNAGLILA